MLFIRVWFIILAVVLMDHTLALADDYLRVSRNGVVFYFYASRAAGQPRPEGPKPLKILPEAQSSGRSSQPKLLPASQLVPLRTGFADQHEVSSPQNEPDPGQLMPDAPVLPQIPHLPEPQETMGSIKGGLLRLLTRLGFFDPPNVPMNEDDSPWLLPHPNLADPFVVPDAWQKAPKYFQEPAQNHNVLAAPAVPVPLPKYVYQPRLWGRVQPSLGCPKASSSLYYCFPVARPFNFRDTWGDPRPNGRIHRAVDIFAPEGTELYAITAGVIQSLGTSSTGGIMLLLVGADGHNYWYMHLLGYAPGIAAGKAVRAGELVGYVGTTGTVNCPAHLHIQAYADHSLCGDSLVNPYGFLTQLCRGIGVSDFNQPRMARKVEPQVNPRLNARMDPKLNLKGNPTRWIQVYRGPISKDPTIKYSSTMVIRNF
jgi:murein DD-endopeptidase MepM/ murein hydrolase activator NlpD